VKLNKKYMTEVVDECFRKLPQSALMMDVDLASRYPDGVNFRHSYASVMERACKARREGADSRANAVEWAYDSLMAMTPYTRVGEVFSKEVGKLDENGYTTSDKIKVFCATCVERPEN